MTKISDFETMEMEGWSDPSIAKGYADGFDIATHLTAKKLSEAVAADQGMRILDLCTGHGVVASELVERGASVVGLDFSDAMIKLARNAVPEAEFVQGDALSMDFADSSFDAVTIGFGVPHFPDPVCGLTEAARVLKPGGKIAFSVWHGKGSNGAFGWLFDAFEKLGDPKVTLPEGPDAHMFTDQAVADRLTSSAGFKNVQLTEIATELKVGTPEALFDVFHDGAVRAASLLRRQPSSNSKAIRQDLANRVRITCTNSKNCYKIPAPAVVISANL